jgi:catalase
MTSFLEQLQQQFQHLWQSLFAPSPAPASPQQKLTDAIVTASLDAQRQTGPDMRQIHAKSHGLVWAELIVEPNLPTDLQAGLFREVKTYPAWVRFSNGGAPQKLGHLKSDREPDVRGIAIKVMDVLPKTLP